MRIRTGYSFHHAVGHLPSVLERLKSLQLGCAPISDRASAFAFAQWTTLCKEHDLRPVYGVELPVTASGSDLDYWTFYAVKDITALYQLIALGTAKTLTYAQAVAAKGLIKITGERVQLDALKPTAGYLWLPLSPSMPKGLYNNGKRAGFRFMATSDNVYTLPEEKEFYRVTIGKRAGVQTYPQHILDDDEWRAAVSKVSDKGTMAAALQARAKALAMCTATLPKATLLRPPKHQPLRTMCEVGAKKKGINLRDPAYKSRLDRELAMIEEKKFEDYFYIVAELVNWAKQRMIVGPARGSSCGSLVCYLLNITAVDPIPFGLLFERFIDITRSDLPDIDIDFEDEKRKLVFDHAAELYGAERIARLGTVSHFKARSALKAAATALRIPDFKIQAVMDVMIERTSGDARANEALTDTFKATDVGRSLRAEFPSLSIAEKMEGHPSNAGQHAAGIIITNEPIRNYVAIDMRNGAAMCDKRDVDTFGLLKIDALGLTQLGTFGNTLQLIGKEAKEGFLEKIPLDDKAAFDVLNRGHFAGIFQFNGIAVQSMAKSIHADCLNDIVCMTALGRPGPMGSGGAQHWSQRRSNKEPVTFAHPLVQPYLEETLGVITYQEQVMQLGREIGDLSWKDVTALRKAMSKSMGEEYFDQFGEKWKATAIRKGMPKEIAEKFWMDLCTFGNWGFNKCICGTTKVQLAYAADKGARTIAQLYKRYVENPSAWIRSNKSKPWLVSLQDDKGWPQQAITIHKNGYRDCIKLTFSDKSTVTCTSDHKFMINGQWLTCGVAKIGDQFTSMVKHTYKKIGQIGKGHAKGKRWAITENVRSGPANVSWIDGRAAYEDQFIEQHTNDPCEQCGNKANRMETHHLDFNHGKDQPLAMQWLCVSCHKKVHYAHGRVKQWGRGYELTTKVLTAIKRVGKRMTYDIEMPTHHNFMLANGLVTHNSHAVAYALVSYWCLWLKAHHPVEFAAATLDAEDDPMRQIALLRELETEGIKYVPVDPDRSTDRWQPHGKNLLGPLTAIKGVGPAAVETIMASRKSGKPLTPAMRALLTNAKTSIGSLYPIADAIAKIDLPARNVVSSNTLIKEVQCNGNDYQVMIIGVLRKLAPKDLNEAVNVSRRLSNGWRGKYDDNEPHLACNIFLTDDTDQIFCQIGRYDYQTLAMPMLERGGTGKAIYAIRGICPSGFRMVRIQALKYLGNLDGSFDVRPERGGAGGKDDGQTGVPLKDGKQVSPS